MKARAAATTAPVRARLSGGAAAPAPRLLARGSGSSPRGARLAGQGRGGTATAAVGSARGAAGARARSARRAGYAGQLAGVCIRLDGGGHALCRLRDDAGGLTAAVDVDLLGGGRARDEAVAKLPAPGARRARTRVDGLRSSPTAGAFAVAWVLAKFTEIRGSP